MSDFTTTPGRWKIDKLFETEVTVIMQFLFPDRGDGPHSEPYAPFSAGGPAVGKRILPLPAEDNALIFRSHFDSSQASRVRAATTPSGFACTTNDRDADEFWLPS